MLFWPVFRSKSCFGLQSEFEKTLSGDQIGSSGNDTTAAGIIPAAVFQKGGKRVITFFHSTSHRAATDAIYRCLQQDVTAGRHAILLVPEHLSHESERLLCLNCGNQSSRWAEVLSFSRLADRISSLEGDADLHAIDQGGRVLLMYRAVQD